MVTDMVFLWQQMLFSFLACNSIAYMLHTLYAIICLSVCHTGLKIESWNFHHMVVQ